MRGVRSRTFITIISLIVLALIIGVILSFTFANRYYIRLKQEDMLKVYNSIAYIFDRAYYTEEELEALDIPEEIKTEEYDLVELCDEMNISLYIQDPAGGLMFVYGNPDILIGRLNDLTLDIEEQKASYKLDENDQYIIQTISEEGTDRIEYIEMWGILNSQNSFLARASFSGIEKSIRAALIFFCFVLLIIFVIAGIIIYILASSYSKPLRQLVAATQKASNMDFSEINEKRLTRPRRMDEISLLGANITEMSKKLEKTVSELKSTNLKLTNELKAKAELDEQRKKYISDISHELKTPIALIAGYAEGLKEGIGATKEDRDYYLDVISDEAEKMNLMVKRISSLNKLEQGQGDVDLQRFNVVDVINGYLNTMALIFDEKQINIFFNAGDVIYVWSDEFLFEEVLMNYLNNAINHVDDNKVISIKVEPIDRVARITVFNSGNHIPDEDIEKVWGEFYKVDKARTREYGGSGLGLSIVKAIADTLNQKCGVYNTEGGVAFYIDLELDKVQVYGKHEMEKRSNVKISELPLWKTTTKILKDTSDRLEAQAKERAEKDQQRKELKAQREALKKEKALKEALKKDGKALRDAIKKDEHRKLKEEAQRKKLEKKQLKTGKKDAADK